MAIKQRSIKLSTPLGNDVLLFQRMTATEALGRLFEFDIEALSEERDIDLDQLLGQNVTVSQEMLSGPPRFFNGFVSHFAYLGESGDLAAYHLSVRPWLWLLTQTADCRIFQESTVPDIIKKVFSDRGFSDFEERLSRSYRQWEYCVQYRETDFNFVSRLMEQEGIYYFFVHEEGKNKLIIADSYSAHEPWPGYKIIPYFPPDRHDHRVRDHIDGWSVSHRVRTGVFVHNDFDFKVPSKKLEKSSSISRDHAWSDLEVYDYPGEYDAPDDGEQYARIRAEEIQAPYMRVRGQGNAKGVAAGTLFELSEYPRDEQNREYLVVSATHELTIDDYQAGRGSAPKQSQVQFEAMPANEPFRTARITPKPIVQGPQTALVVGPSGEEIWTDEHGRVKVQFHWDRYGQEDENSSCWIRVAQVWAGKNWGAMHIPRIGQEVIVEFLEGDPDRPIITGRVYNGTNTPPYGLPANKTQSGIKSRSSKGGSGDNFNEIRFEDKQGEEQVYVHAEKNQDNVVENDESTSVGHDRSEDIGNDETISIGHDRTETVGNNETIAIGVNRTETVGSNETVSIGSNRSVTIGSNKTETIGINKAETIGVAKELTIGGAYQVSVGAVMNETVAASKSMQVGANLSEDIGSNRSVDVGGDQSLSVGKNQTTSVGKDDTLTVGKNLVIDAGDSIVIKTGKATISMKKDGTISIQGKDITVNGSGKINVKASKDIIMKGKKILQN